MDRNGSQILLLQDAGCSYENNGQTEWNLRYLQAKDLDAVCAICRESFPLDYPNSWFEEVVTGKFISFGLFHCDTLTSLLVAEVKRVSQCDAEVRGHKPAIRRTLKSPFRTETCTRIAKRPACTYLA